MKTHIQAQRPSTPMGSSHEARRRMGRKVRRSSPSVPPVSYSDWRIPETTIAGNAHIKRR
jgi:hypothetical protein